MDKYYLDKPGKQPYTSVKLETILAEIIYAKQVSIYLQNQLILSHINRGYR
jgi:hypothetical protein